MAHASDPLWSTACDYLYEAGLVENIYDGK
jgi:hypothetical protein